MRIEPFKPAHLNGATAHVKQKHHQWLLDSDPFSNVGMSWSAVAGDGLVAVGGLGHMEDGGLGVWLLFTDRITPGRFVAIYRELKRRLAQVLDAGETVTVHIDPGFPEAARLAEKLGFRKDGEFRFDDGKKMIRMVADAENS